MPLTESRGVGDAAPYGSCGEKTRGALRNRRTRRLHQLFAAHLTNRFRAFFMRVLPVGDGVPDVPLPRAYKYTSHAPATAPSTATVRNSGLLCTRFQNSAASSTRPQTSNSV